MNNINDIIVTEELRKEYPHHTDNSIRCTEYIRQQSTERLLEIIDRKGIPNSYDSELNLLVKELSPTGEYINYNWILSRIGECLYEREILDDDDYCRLQELID